MKKALFTMVVVGAFLHANAQDVLFYTDFVTAPPGFKAASEQATNVVKGDLVLVMNLPPSTALKDTVIDGCTLSCSKSSTDTTRIVISKSTQSPNPYGDFADATNGRLALKNSKSSFTLPSVTGPCTITYHVGGSSDQTGKSISCLINDMDYPDAGFAELLLDGKKATRKKVFYCSVTGPVVFKFTNQSTVYIYDIKVVSGCQVPVMEQIALKPAYTPIKTTGLTILNDNNLRLHVFNLAGAAVLTSDKSRIDMRSLVKGMYVVRAAGGKELFTFVR